VYYFTWEGGGIWKPRAIFTGGVESFGAQIRMLGCAALITSTPDIETGPAPTQPGYVHVYNRCARGDGTWSYISSFTAPGSRPADHFGAAIAFEGTTLVVGAPGEDNDRGAAYYYRYENHGWVLKQRLTLVIPVTTDVHFGLGIGLRGGLLVIGAPSGRSGSNGVVHQFLFDSATARWNYCCSTVPERSIDHQKFGSQIVVTANRVIVAAPTPRESPLPGHVYLFRRVLGAEGESLSQELDIEGQGGGSLGADIAVSGSGLVIGEPFLHSQPGSSDGFAYVYQLPP
jgi:hypothetical protein